MRYLADIHMSVMFLVVDEDILSGYLSVTTHAAGEVTVEAVAFQKSLPEAQLQNCSTLVMRSLPPTRSRNTEMF
jgi:hypothetical protein